MVNLKFLKNIIVKFQYNLVNMKYLENFNEYAEYFNNIDFIMFTPDSIVMNEFANVVKKYNIKILNYKCININEYEAEKIYSNELCTGKIDSWWIKKKIFSMGLTCVALITLDIKKHNMLASDIILALKGDSDSLISSHNSIRGQYRVANKTYGFMHSSDSPKQALFESNTFFSINEIKNSFHKLKIGENVNESFFNDFILNFNFITRILWKANGTSTCRTVICTGRIRHKVIIRLPIFAGFYRAFLKMKIFSACCVLITFKAPFPRLAPYNISVAA